MAQAWESVRAAEEVRRRSGGVCDGARSGAVCLLAGVFAGDRLAADTALLAPGDHHLRFTAAGVAELDESPLQLLENRLELYPWEYIHQAKNERETKAVTITSPVRWVLTYHAGYTLSQVLQAVGGKEQRQGDALRQFVVNRLYAGFRMLPANWLRSACAILMANRCIRATGGSKIASTVSKSASGKLRLLP